MVLGAGAKSLSSAASAFGPAFSAILRKSFIASDFHTSATWTCTNATASVGTSFKSGVSCWACAGSARSRTSGVKRNMGILGVNGSVLESIFQVHGFAAGAGDDRLPRVLREALLQEPHRAVGEGRVRSVV